MKRLIPALITTTLCAALLDACKTDDEMHTVFDVYYETAFTTDSTNAVLPCAARPDSADKVWDVWLNIKGGFKYVATSDIVEYGHCWVKGNNVPSIDVTQNNFKAQTGNLNPSEPFFTRINDLECETEYSIRSYVKTSDGRIAYNPNTLVVTTDHPHNKWFETNGLQNNSILSGRSDCLNIMTIVDGDTLTFFGMGRAGATLYNDLWCYSSKKKTYEQIPQLKIRNEVMALWGAVGFGLNYVDNGSVAHHLLYVGCGCKTTDDALKITDYNQDFFVYDIDTRLWARVSYRGEDSGVILLQPFQGLPRTGGIGFSIMEWGFIGLGEYEHNGQTHYHSDIYLFMMDRDEKKEYSPTSGYFLQMTEDFGFGRRSGASVVVVDNDAYIIGGKGEGENGKTKYYDEFIPCHFNLPVNSHPDSYTFSWPTSKNPRHFNDNLRDEYNMEYNFKPRAFGSAFSVDGKIYYGLGEGMDENGKIEYYSDMIKYDLSTNFVPELRAPYMNEDGLNSRVSRATVINGGDRAFVVGGAQQGDGDYVIYNNSEWVYRP